MSLSRGNREPEVSLFVMQDVLNGSDHQAVLFLGNLVEGKYSFTLTVSDSKGQSSSDRGGVEVRAGRTNTHRHTNAHTQSSHHFLVLCVPVRRVGAGPGGAAAGGPGVSGVSASAGHAAPSGRCSPGRAGR